MREQSEGARDTVLARSLVFCYRAGMVVVVLVLIRFALRWYLSATGFYYLTPYPPPWWVRVLGWLM